ncbi:MAG: aldose 1-epimerase family protein [Roseburia sp.]
MEISLHSNGYQVLVHTLGAELKSYTNPYGHEYIWNSDPAYWMHSSPLLFPTIGNVRNGETTIHGKIFSMPKHGFCKESEFEVAAQARDSVRFLLKSNEKTRLHYPYQFELYLSYQLDGAKLSMDYMVVNKDTKTMFYHIGAHPGFMLPISDTEVLSDCVLEFEKEERFWSYEYDLAHLEFNEEKKVMQQANGTTLPLTIKMFDKDAIFFENTNSHKVSFLNAKTKKGVTIFYPDFASIAFWTPAGGNAPFLCLEPWNGSAIFHQDDDIFSHKRGILSLAPESRKRYHLEISLNE